MKNDKCIHGLAGNTNAVKELTKSAVLNIRCTPAEKKAWTQAAKKQKLAAWVSSALNNAAN
jgi:hypothetical protein